MIFAGLRLGGQGVHDDDVAGRECRYQYLLDPGEERRPVHRTIDAVMPDSRSPPTNVVVFQWPFGTAAMQRFLGAQAAHAEILMQSPDGVLVVGRIDSQRGMIEIAGTGGMEYRLGQRPQLVSSPGRWTGSELGSAQARPA